MKKVFFALTIIFSMMSILLVSAAEPPYVTVRMNGQLLHFPDPQAQPQIVNGRTMVPFRQAAEFLGIDLHFEDATRTISFDHNGRSFIHVMFTSFVIIDGQTIVYDTGSQNINGFTLMPLNMLLDAVEAEATWDNATRTALIQTRVEEEPEPEPEPEEIVVLPFIMNLTTNVASVESGEPVIITVVASSGTNAIRLNDGADRVLTTINTFSTDPDGTRIFTHTWTPVVERTGFVNLRATAEGLDTNLQQSAQQTRAVSVLVNAPVAGTITDIESRNANIIVDEVATFYIYTNDVVERIFFSNDSNSRTSEVTNFTTLSNGERRFTVTETFHQTGDVILTVQAATRHGFDSDATETQRITVISNSPHAWDSVVIDSIVLNSSVVRPGEIVSVRVITTFAVDRVRIFTQTGEIIATRTDSNSSNSAINERVWDFEIRIPIDSHGMDFIFFASATSGQGVDEERFIIRSDRDAEISHLRVRDIEYTNFVRVGRSVPVTLTTSFNANSIEVRDSSNVIVHSSNNSHSDSQSADTRTWFFDLDINSTGNHRFSVHVFDSFGNRILERIDIVGTNTTAGGGSPNQNQSGRIIRDFDLDRNNVIFDSFVDITVITDPNIDRVWIEDDSGRILHELSWRTRISGGLHEWDMRFRANFRNSGNVTYTIVAQRGNTRDSMNFTVRIDPASGSNNQHFIRDFNLLRSAVTFDDWVDIRVITEQNIDRVWIEDPDGRILDERSWRTRVSGEFHEWDLDFRANFRNSGNVTYTIVAERGNARDRLTFNVRIDPR